MLNAILSLQGFDIRANDGSLGTVSDFLIDDSTWKVRWMVVDTGGWLSGRKVLVHPSAVISAEYVAMQLKVSLSKAQVEASPNIADDKPVSQQMQGDIYSYYGWDPLWGGGVYGAGMYGGSMSAGGLGAIASPLSSPVYFGAAAVQEAERAERDGTDPEQGDPHLRSLAEVTGYHVQATDGDIGHIEDLLIDSENWTVRYLIVDTSNWWFGQHVLVSPHAVTGVDWSDRHVQLDLTKERIRSGPAWNPAEPISDAYEQRLNHHYKWPGYGKGSARPPGDDHASRSS